MQQLSRTEVGITIQHCRLWAETHLFAAVALILVQCTNSKREKVLFRPQNVNRGVIFWSDVQKIRENRETTFLPLGPMRFVLPTSGHDLPCAVPKFTGIHAVIAQPAYSVYDVVEFGETYPVSRSFIR